MYNFARGLITIGITAALMGAGTFAVFTSQATNPGNTFTTGTVILNADSEPETPGNQTTALFNVDNMAPGISKTQELVMRNDGTLDLTYDGSVSQTGGDANLYNALNLKIGTTSGAGDVYDGMLSSFGGFTGGERMLSAGSNESLFFTVGLPADAGDDLQGKTIEVEFTFDATQSPLPGA